MINVFDSKKREEKKINVYNIHLYICIVFLRRNAFFEIMDMMV